MLILHNNRKGSRLGHDTVIDGMLKDGLWDVYNDFGMGVCAELCADQHNITREEQVVFFSCLSGLKFSLLVIFHSPVFMFGSLQIHCGNI